MADSTGSDSTLFAPDTAAPFNLAGITTSGLPPPGLVGQVLALDPTLTPVWATLPNPPIFGNFAAEVIADSPTNWWRVNDTSGTVIVDTMSHLNGSYGGHFTLADTIGPLPHDVQNVASLLYDTGMIGAGNMTFAQSNANFGNNHSLEIWRKNEGDHTPSIYDGWSNAFATGDRWMALRRSAGVAPNIHIFANDIDQGAFGDGNLWSQIVWTYNGSSILVYLNANLIATQNVIGGGIRLNATYIQFGNATTDAAFVSHIAETITYNSTLSAARVAAHYNAR